MLRAALVLTAAEQLQNGSGTRQLSRQGSSKIAPQPVLPFSKLNTTFIGYFDPEKIFLANENK